MKDDKEHIDQLFESLNDRQFDIPEDFLEDLNKRLDNEPKRTKRFLWWFLASLVLTGVIAICYVHYSDTPEINPPVSQVNKSIAKDEYKERSKTQNNSSLSKQNQNKQSQVDSVSIPSATKALSTASRTQLVKKQVKVIKKPGNQTNTSKPVQWSKRTFKTQNDSINQLSKRIKNTNKRSHAEIHKGTQPKLIKSGKSGTLHKADNIRTSKTKTNGNDPLNSVNNEKIRDQITQTSIPEISNAPSAVKPDKEELSKESVPEKETDSATAQNAIDTTLKVDSNQAETDETKSKTPGNKWKKEVVIFAGLGGNTTHDSPKNSEYLAKINQNKTSVLAPSFGVNANLAYKNFTFGSGINYEQTGEKFKVDIKSAELKDSTYSEFIQDTIWVQDSIGNWFPVPHDTTIYHTVQYTDSAWISQSFQNRYSWISIPLHFGYRFELGDYELIPRIGAVFNFGIARGGTYPNASFNNSNRYPPAKFTVSYLIQLEARRNFDNWFVFINPYFRSMINPAVSGDVIRRKYTSWGMQFGIGFNF